MLIIKRPTVESIGDEADNRQKFSIGPLEPGFGHTIGNSLRRTLLSSIPGSAITQVRFDEALHEFDTIPGITEDVTDIVLNLKDVVLRSHSEEPVNLRVEVRGPAVVTAAAVDRFMRPVTWQGMPQQLLPVALRNDNPWGIPRRVDGVLTLA